LQITRRALETEVSNSSANLEVEKGRAGFAYMQGMGDCNHLLKQLQKLESSIEDLKGDNAKVYYCHLYERSSLVHDIKY